jgi:hypothetical protein
MTAQWFKSQKTRAVKTLEIVASTWKNRYENHDQHRVYAFSPRAGKYSKNRRSVHGAGSVPSWIGGRASAAGRYVDPRVQAPVAEVVDTVRQADRSGQGGVGSRDRLRRFCRGIGPRHVDGCGLVRYRRPAPNDRSERGRGRETRAQRSAGTRAGSAGAPLKVEDGGNLHEFRYVDPTGGATCFLDQPPIMGQTAF